MIEIKNFNDDEDIYLSSNDNYNVMLTEEDLEKIKDKKLKNKAITIHEEILWLKNYRYIEQKFKIIFEVIYSIFQENKKEVCITKVTGEMKSYINQLNDLLNKIIYNQMFSSFKIEKIKNDIENYKDIIKDMVEEEWSIKRKETFSYEILLDLNEMLNRTFENLQSLLKFSVDGRERKDINIIKININQNDNDEIDEDYIEEIRKERNDIHIEAVCEYIKNENCDSDGNIKSYPFFYLYLYNIKDEDERLKIENKILSYKEKSELFVKWLNNHLKKEDLNREDLDDVIRELISEMGKFKYENILKEFQIVYSEMLSKFYLVFHDLLNDTSLPKNKNNNLNDINSRDIENKNKTELHKKFENYHDDSSNNEIINLIKLGANTTLKDDDGKIPFDFINAQNINNITSELKKLIAENKEEEINNKEEKLRILKCIIEMDEYIKRNFNHVEYKIKFKNDNVIIETSEKDLLDEKKEYFEELKNLIKEELEKDNKSGSDNDDVDDDNDDLLYDKLNLHIWHNENYYLRKEREKYFRKQISENNKIINKAISNDNINVNGNSDEDSDPDSTNNNNNYDNNKKTVTISEDNTTKDNGNNDLEIEKAKMENELIEKYLLEESNEEFINLRNKIINELEILSNNNYKMEINSIFEKELKNYFKEYPSEIEAIIDRNNKCKKKGGEKDFRHQKAIINVFKNIGIKFETLSKDTKKIVELINNESDELNEIPNKIKNKTVKKIIYKNENDNDNVNENTTENETSKNESYIAKSNEITKYNEEEDISKRELGTTASFKSVTIDDPINRDNNNNNNNNNNKRNGHKENNNKGRNESLIVYGNKNEEENQLPSMEIVKKNAEKVRTLISERKFEEIKKVISSCKEIIGYQKEEKLNLLSQMVVKLDKENLDAFIDIVKENPEMINDIELATNKKNNNLLTPIHYIIEKINQDSSAIEILEKVLPYVSNSELLKIKNKEGMNIFDKAIATNNMDAFKLLYEKTLKLDKNWISRKENYIHVQYALLNNKAMTPVELKSIIENIIEKKSEVDELPYNEASTEEKKLFSNIINDNSINHQQSLLHISSYINNKEIVDYLLKQDSINLDRRDEDRRTPLIYAILAKNESIATELIKCGADINALDNFGMTPIFYAVFSKNIDIINTLIMESESQKIDILMKKDFYQRSPLNYALMMENEKMVNLISDNIHEFEKINDIEKRNVLHYAIACKNLNNIKSIFSAITNKNQMIFNNVDNNGRTALHYAAESKNCQILEIFLNHKEYFDFQIKDHYGFKAVDYLLMNEITGDDIEHTIGIIISHMINDERMFKENYYGKNIFFSAFSNPVNPDKSVECVMNVFEANKILDKVKILITSLISKDTMVLEIGLKNKRISNDLLKDLIIKTELESEIGKEKLKKKLLQNDRKELAIKLELIDIENNAEVANRLIKNSKSIPEIKSLLHIPKNIKCENFKSYDYAILLDKSDWYLEFTKFDKMEDDIYDIKKKVLKYNSLNVLSELLKLLLNFTDKSLWKMASPEAKEIILKHYKKTGILEKEIIRAANCLNTNFVKKGLDNSINTIIGLLHIAIHNNSKKLAKIIIDKYGKKVFDEKIEINGKLMTPSEYMISFENGIINKKEILTYLIMNGAQISEIKKENLNDVEILINKFIANVKEKATLLSASSEVFEAEIKNKLNKNNINETDSLGNTLLFYAIENNDKEKVNILINKFPNLNINIENNYHETPLFYAIKYASKEIVELLINKGGNIEIEINNKSLLHYAFNRKITVKEDGIKEKKIKESRSESSVALLLMKKGLIDLAPKTINETVKYNWGYTYENITQLMYQIIEGNQEKAKKLIHSVDIDLTIKDSENCTAYGYAKYKKNTEIMKLLEEKGCDKEEQEKILKDFFGITNTRTAMSMTGGFLLESFEFLAKNTPVEKLYNLIQNNKIIEMGYNYMDDDKKELMDEMIKYKNKFKESSFITKTSKKLADSVKSTLPLVSSEEPEEMVRIELEESEMERILDGTDGHLSNTPYNKTLLEEIANNPDYEEDEFGHRWCIQNKNNVQFWVRYRGNSINEGGETDDIRSIINNRNYFDEVESVMDMEGEISLYDLFKNLYIKLKEYYQNNKEDDGLRDYLSGMNPFFFKGEGSAIPSIYLNFKNNINTNSNVNGNTESFDKKQGLDYINNYIRNGKFSFSSYLKFDKL